MALFVAADRAIFVSTVEVAAVHFVADDGDVGLRSGQRIGLPRKTDGRNFDLRLELAGGASAGEAEMFGGVFILHGLAGGFPNHLESHARGSGDRVKSRPARLIDYGDILHLQREDAAIGTDCEAVLWDGNDPVESRRRDGRMKIVNLVCGGHRSPEERESYVSEAALLRRAGGPIFSLHHAVISCGAAEGDAISLVVGAHACESAAAGDAAFEMVDVGRLEIRACWLIVTAIFVERWNWVRVGAAIRGHRLLVMRCVIRRANCERE